MSGHIEPRNLITDVAGVKVACGDAVERHPKARDAGLWRRGNFRQRDEELLKERRIAQKAIAAFHFCSESAAGNDLDIFGRAPCEPPFTGRSHDGFSQRMV